MASSTSSRLGAIGDDLGVRSFNGGRGGGRRVMRAAAVIAGLLILLMLLPTTVTYINPGHVGILIHRAVGGVDPTPLGAGLQVLALSEHLDSPIDPRGGVLVQEADGRFRARLDGQPLPVLFTLIAQRWAAPR